MLEAKYKKHELRFIQPGGTSRGVLTRKDSWYLMIWDNDAPDKVGIGECGIIPHLSIDDRFDFELMLVEVIADINQYNRWLEERLFEFPAIRFGLETAILDLQNQADRILFPSEFTSGHKSILINGLVWMGDYEFMRKQIIDKIKKGFRCIKLKIGSIDFEDELSLLKMIRKDFSSDELELRVDANGAFVVDEALEKLKRLSDFSIHSIEQPIKQNQHEQMAELCMDSPLAIALDEELIGVTDHKEIRTILQTIQPDFIILKPGLLGGFKQSEIFIKEAEKLGVKWWITSALEGNIGLNAIAQWTFTLNNPLPQGLGTGKLFSNNIPSPLAIKNAQLYYKPNINWNLNYINHD